MIEKQVAIVLITLIVLGGIGVGYTLAEPTLRTIRGEQMQDELAHKGAELFHSQGCITCHLENGYGALQGGVGWPLNTTENQRGSETELAARAELIHRTIDRGRPNTPMSPFGRDNGGPLNTEQINALVAYIQSDLWPTAPVDGAAAELVKQAQSGAAAGGGGGSEGAQLFSSSGCIGCHKVGGQGGAVGPDLSHIGTQAATLKPGMSAEDFIHESIVTPNAYVAEGFQPGIMPQTFGQTLQPEQIDALVKYLAEQK